MGYPLWITKTGDLGKVSSQQFFDLVLQAEDPNGQGEITFELIAGTLPKGLQVDPNGYINGSPERSYTVQGVPFSTNVDITSNFTIRAKNSLDDSITDRSFFITVTGNFPPVITSLADPLGTFLDGTEISLQLNAIDINTDDTLTWSLLDGNLPPGITLDSNGLISGIIKPTIYSFSDSVTGWNQSNWNKNSWEFSTRSNNATFNFTASVTDGKAVVNQKYKIVVFAFNDLRADSATITADTINLTTDVYPRRPPIMLTKDLGDYATVNSGGYFSFKFDGVNYDNLPFAYNLSVSSGDGWDSDIGDSKYWDTTLFDRSDTALPPGLSLDPVTGWLTGYIPPQVEVTKDYQFGVYLQSNTDADNRSPIKTYTITILGNIDLAVTWDTPSDLGSINVGAVSNIAVSATAANGRDLTYRLVTGSHLPQGLQLLPDGTLSGRVSFQTMGFDHGATTFDKTLASKFIYSSNTNFDSKYTFTVICNDFFNQLSSQQTFTISVAPVTYEPYENLYIRCLPASDRRVILETIINNTDIFDPNDIYRPIDPYFGIQNEIKFLVSYGIKSSKTSDYIAAMQARHFQKKFYFGDYKLAQGKDVAGNVLYDVIYVDVIENTKIYENNNGITKKLIPAPFTNMNSSKAKWRNPRAASLKQNQLFSDNTIATDDTTAIFTNDSWYAFERLNVISPNDLTLMQNDLSANLQNSYLNSLPEWMVSVQKDNKVLGFTTGAVLAYLKPGTGEKALYNINRFVPFDIKYVPLVADRYVLNSSYSENFDIDSGSFITHKYTSFDYTSKGGNPITPVVNVDFAVDRPFESINGQPFDDIVASGGFDGINYNFNKKYIIFARQENYDESVWGALTNDGWNQYYDVSNSFDPHIYEGSIPGYADKLDFGSIQNQRAGVWQITVNSTNVVWLTFIREINPGEYVLVTEGTSHANSFQLYDLNAMNNGFTVPSYTQTFSQVYLPRKPTTFDSNATNFLNNVETYTVPLQNDKYLAFPKIGVFTNGQ